MAAEDPAVRALVRIYLDLEARLKQALLTATVEGWEWRRCQALLAQVERELVRLDAYVADWERRAVQASWADGVATADERLAAVGMRQGEAETWHQLASDRLEALARDVAGQRTRFLRGSILRGCEGYLRDLSSGAVARGLGLGMAPRELGAALRDDALGERLANVAGLIEDATGVAYTDGSVHSLHAWGEMSARTGMMRTFAEATALRYETAGVTLYTVSSHETLCWLCRPFEGTTWALTDEGEAAGYPRCPREVPFHPNCRHSLLPHLVEVHGEGHRLEERVAGMSDRQLYARMRDEEPDGKQLLRWARDGFRNEREARALTARGVTHGPRFREAGIEARRLEAERRVLTSGGAVTYRQALAQVTGERMRDTGRGIFAGKGGRNG